MNKKYYTKLGRARTVFFSDEDWDFLRDVQHEERKKHNLEKPRSLSSIAIDIFHNGKVPFINNRKLDINSFD